MFVLVKLTFREWLGLPHPSSSRLGKQRNEPQGCLSVNLLPSHLQTSALRVTSSQKLADLPGLHRFPLCLYFPAMAP